MKRLTITETADWLNENDGYLILTHKKPDGDTVGSAAALAKSLNSIGKTAYLYRNTEITEKYLPFAEGLFAPDGFEYSKVVSVDTASVTQIAAGAESFSEKVDLAIDHHMSNTGYAGLTCVEDRASCGEIICELTLLLCGKIDRDIADCLYTAVSTDTGCFVYGNTTAATLKSAAVIAEAGADLPRLNKMLFRTKKKSRAMLEGTLYSNMHYYFDGKAAVSTITLKLREETGVTEDDLDDIASLPSGIEGVLAGITLKEQVGSVKVSVRTSGPVNANDICAAFGGGGHRQAAGCTINGDLKYAEEKLIETVGKVLS